VSACGQDAGRWTTCKIFIVASSHLFWRRRLSARFPRPERLLV